MSNIGRSTVLVVDDTPVNIKVLAVALRDDYQVMIANSGEKALELLQAGDLPDLILLDIMMPEMDGYEVCRRLKADQRTRNIPVIFITARDGQEDEVLGLSLGAVDYITKPFMLPVVKARVRTHVELKRKYDLLDNLAFMDAATGIPNRRYFEYYLQKQWRRKLRDSAPLALGLARIDSFAEIVASHGQGAGEACLRQVGQALWKSANRPGYAVARHAEQDFAVLMPDSQWERVLDVAEGMRANVAALEVSSPEGPVRATVSLGVASVVPSAATSTQELVAGASVLLEKAVREGGDRVSCAGPG